MKATKTRAYTENDRRHIHGKQYNIGEPKTHPFRVGFRQNLVLAEKGRGSNFVESKTMFVYSKFPHPRHSLAHVQIHILDDYSSFDKPVGSVFGNM